MLNIEVCIYTDLCFVDTKFSGHLHYSAAACIKWCKDGPVLLTSYINANLLMYCHLQDRGLHSDLVDTKQDFSDHRYSSQYGPDSTSINIFPPTSQAHKLTGYNDH